MTDYGFAQRAVLGALLDAHPRLLEVDELDDQLESVPRTREALRVLVDDGLATKLGDRVGASRAAVRVQDIAAAGLTTIVVYPREADEQDDLERVKEVRRAPPRRRW